jgi:hypothetical protein
MMDEVKSDGVKFLICLFFRFLDPFFRWWELQMLRKPSDSSTAGVHWFCCPLRSFYAFLCYQREASGLVHL